MGGLFKKVKPASAPPPVAIPDEADAEEAKRKKLAMQSQRSSSVSTVLSENNNQKLGG